MTENKKTIIFGIVAILVLVFIKIYIEHSWYGQWFNTRGYEILHSFISTYNAEEELPVVVLDISDIELKPDGTVSSDKLKEIIQALVESKAKAIAIDVDFSPRLDINQKSISTVARAEEDEEFFEFLRNQKIPVFVGVYNPGVRPAEWLGLEENKDLAADITFTDDNTMEIPKWFQCDGNPKLNSLSNALSEKFEYRPSSPDWLKIFLKDYEEKENLKSEELLDNNGYKVKCHRAYMLVNYAKLELIQKLNLTTLNKESVLQAKNSNGISKFQDKVVIIGKGQRDKATDPFVVIGRKAAVFGVYIHATAVYTVIADPVYRFKEWVGWVLDIILGLIVIVGVLSTQYKYPNTSEFLIIGIAIAIAIILGIFLVTFYNILWLDFSLVILALLLHSSVQRGLELIAEKFGKTLRNLFN